MQTEFIPVSANTQDLQYHRSPAQKWFLALVAKTQTQSLSTRSGSLLSGEGPGHRLPQLDLNRQMACTEDPQGMYVVGADGTAYGFTNDHGPEDITRFMDAALARFHAHPPHAVVITEAEKAAPFSIIPPRDATVLRVLARIASKIPPHCSFLNEGVGRDWCWLFADERAEILHKAQTLPVGATFALPPAFARRIARFHLVDDVRGTPDLWTPSQVHQLSLTARVGEGEGHRGRRLLLSGAFHNANAGGRHGYEGTLNGWCDVQNNAISRFRLLADGQAWGAGIYTPNPPPGRFNLRVALTETPPEDAAISRIVPPEAVATANRTAEYRKA